MRTFPAAYPFLSALDLLLHGRRACLSCRDILLDLMAGISLLYYKTGQRTPSRIIFLNAIKTAFKNPLSGIASQRA